VRAAAAACLSLPVPLPPPADEPDFRPRIRVKGLSEGHATISGEGAENYFYRSLCDGRTLVTWEIEKICKIGAKFDLRSYPVDVQGLDICLEMKTGLAETVLVPFPDEATFAHTPSGQVGVWRPQQMKLPRSLLLSLLLPVQLLCFCWSLNGCVVLLCCCAD
jgi:hypothetical protein